ncbi:ClpXP protease specificity-enhancing factor [Halomonas denitrificans]|uniref:ClpXP protease specificity-enhancing factor n=1 Tax=Halomonas denitrificans TaxID=370769 RepID=UPI001C98E902|nr:ClpXP protease specificity-enhancing factor [Halomonas denitrificans]MBY5969348.1 ClpXP protease specificity-enhancing factor [Halomonas denitrificans]
MKSSRPYLARALYEWLLDNELTPYIVVDAEYDNVEVPRQFVQNGQIVLNLGPSAVRDLHMGNDMIRFSARFSGKSELLFVPIPALIALYARENGVGMVFGHEPELPTDEANDVDEAPVLESVKRPQADAEPSEQQNAESSGEEERTSAAEADETGAESDAKSDGQAKPPRKGRPSLRVIK